MIRRILAVGAVIALAGCAHNESKTTTKAPTQAAAMSTTCPLVPNTTVQCRDIANGVALVFVTSGDTDQLRTRVHNMAAYEEQASASASSGAVGSNEPGYETSGPAGTPSYSTSGEARASQSTSQAQQPQVGGSDGENGGISSGSAGSMGQTACAGGDCPGKCACNSCPGGTTGCAAGAMGFFGVPVKAQVQDISGGSQLNLQPVDPGQLGALRENAQHVAMEMQSGKCPSPGAATSPAPSTHPSSDQNPSTDPSMNPSPGSNEQMPDSH